MPESMFHSIQTIKQPHKYAHCKLVFPSAGPFPEHREVFVRHIFSLAQHSIFLLQYRKIPIISPPPKKKKNKNNNNNNNKPSPK